jgi:hypothetical protein
VTGQAARGDVRRPDRDAQALEEQRYTSYYGRPIVKPPVWKPELPFYFFTGGLAGASSMLALGAEAVGNRELARAARRVAATNALVSPALLIADLGVPRRFLNMLRVFRPTSPLSMGAWLLVGYVPAAIGSALLAELGWWRPVQRTASAVAAVGGLPMVTYTAVLVADTAIPVWHEARRELPFTFAGSAVASAGGAALVLVPTASSAPARRAALLGVAMEGTAQQLMERRLGPQVRPYREGSAGRFSKAAKALTVTGAAVTAVAGRRRAGAVVGGALLMAGSLSLRWSVFRAGWQSAEDPELVVRLQRDRLARGEGVGTETS